MKNIKTRQIVLTGLFIALGLVLPFLTMQIPTLGSMFTPMHFPVILAGIFLGPILGAVVGFTTPLLRTAIFTMPPMPKSLAMAFELMIIGLVIGIVLKLLKDSKLSYIMKVIIALVIAMILGRIVYAFVLTFFMATPFFELFLASFADSIPGIILQLILIPILATRLKPYARTV